MNGLTILIGLDGLSFWFYPLSIGSREFMPRHVVVALVSFDTHPFTSSMYLVMFFFSLFFRLFISSLCLKARFVLRTLLAASPIRGREKEYS